MYHTPCYMAISVVSMYAHSQTGPEELCQPHRDSEIGVCVCVFVFVSELVCPFT